MLMMLKMKMIAVVVMVVIKSTFPRLTTRVFSLLLSLFVVKIAFAVSDDPEEVVSVGSEVEESKEAAVRKLGFVGFPIGEARRRRRSSRFSPGTSDFDEKRRMGSGEVRRG